VITPQKVALSISDSGAVAFMANFNSSNGLGILFRVRRRADRRRYRKPQPVLSIDRRSTPPDRWLITGSIGPQRQSMPATAARLLRWLRPPVPTFSDFSHFSRINPEPLDFAGHIDGAGAGIFDRNLASPIAQYRFRAPVRPPTRSFPSITPTPRFRGDRGF